MLVLVLYFPCIFSKEGQNIDPASNYILQVCLVKPVLIVGFLLPATVT